MTAHPRQDTTLEALFELLNQEGLEALGRAFVLLLNQAMKLERQHYLGLEPYERYPDERHDWANGYKDTTIKTRLGELTFETPQVRQGGLVRDCAVLIASGVALDGKREVLGVSISMSQAEVHWRGFLQALQRRGLHGVPLIISDDHAGLKAARRAVFAEVPWQRCQFHLQQNAQAYVPPEAMKPELGRDLGRVFNAADLAEAQDRLATLVKKYQERAPQLSQRIETDLVEGLTVFAFPESHRRRLRRTNMLERLNRQIRRRPRVVSQCPNEASSLRLVTAVVMEISEEWPAGCT